MGELNIIRNRREFSDILLYKLLILLLVYFYCMLCILENEGTKVWRRKRRGRGECRASRQNSSCFGTHGRAGLQRWRNLIVHQHFLHYTTINFDVFDQHFTFGNYHSFKSIQIGLQIQVTLQSGLILVGSKLVLDEENAKMMRFKPGKQVITLLLMMNCAQFLMNVFEAQKAGVDEEIVRMYGNYYWAVLIRGCSPLTIFFR